MTLPKTMQAVLLTGHGGPEKLELRDDVPRPEPGPGEVLVEVSACGINNTDIWVREGAYGTDEDPDAVASWRRAGENTLSFPRIQGADTAGHIVAVGAGVSEARVGERVMVDFSLYNRADDSLVDIDYIGHGRDGGFAEYCVVPADHAHLVQSPMSDAELATFCCAYLTGEHMLDRAAVAAGERVLITGASGGVGSGLVQLCRARGAIPYAIVGPGKEAAVAALGAEAVIAREVEDLPAAVAQATRGAAAIDVVADLVAGPMFNDLLTILRPEGRYTTAGAIAGPVVTLDLRTVYLKHLQIHGSSQGTRAAFRRLVGYIEEGKIKAVLAGAYRLSEIHRAQADFVSKCHVGKLVLVPDSKWEAVGAALRPVNFVVQRERRWGCRASRYSPRRNCAPVFVSIWRPSPVSRTVSGRWRPSDIVMPPILRLDIHEFNGEVDVKTAYVPGLDSFAIKISPGFFDNPKLGLPSVNGLMVLFSAKTGMVEAVLLDNGYLTDVRTAAAGAR